MESTLFEIAAGVCTVKLQGESHKISSLTIPSIHVAKFRESSKNCVMLLLSDVKIIL
jgi:hypothetical protein